MNNVEDFHVLPNNDIRKHKETDKCRCNPEIVVVENGNRVIIHYAFDNRELRENLNQN